LATASVPPRASADIASGNTLSFDSDFALDGLVLWLRSDLLAFRPARISQIEMQRKKRMTTDTTPMSQWRRGHGTRKKTPTITANRTRQVIPQPHATDASPHLRHAIWDSGIRFPHFSHFLSGLGTLGGVLPVTAENRVFSIWID